MYLLFALLIISVYNYYLCRDVRYPAFILSVLWLAVMSVYYWAPIPIDPIGTDTEIVIALAVGAFSLAGLLLVLGAKKKLRASKKPLQVESISPEKFDRPTLNKILLFLSIALLPLLFLKARELSARSNYDLFLVGLRSGLSEESSEGYGFLGNIILLSYFTTFVWGSAVSNWSKASWYFYLSVATSLSYGLLTTGRTALFLLVIVLTGISIMKKQIRATRLILAISACFMFFASFAVIMGKGGNLKYSWAENAEGVIDSFFSYLIGPIAALDSVVSRTAHLDGGQNTFIGVLNIIYKFQGKPLISPIQQFVAVPFLTNVYTAIQPLYLDFGALGVFFGFLLLGFITTYFYLKASRGNNLYIYLYSLSLFPLLVSTFTDQYFAPVSGWMKYFVAGYLYFESGLFRTSLKKNEPLKETMLVTGSNLRWSRR